MPRLLTRPGPPLELPFEANTDSIQARGLVGWWPTLGPGAQGAALPGMAGPRPMMTLGNGPLYVGNPTVGRMLSFNGTTQAGSASPTAGTAFQQTTPFSVAFWYASTDADGPIVANYAVGAVAGWQIDINAGSIRGFLLNSGATAGRGARTTSTAFGGGALTHVVATYSGNSAASGWSISINGAAVAMTTALDTDPGTLGNNGVWLAFNNSVLYAGLLADPRVYNRVLSPAEIFQLYAAQTRWELYRPIKARTPGAEQRPFGAPDWISIPRIRRPAPAHQFSAPLQSTLAPGPAAPLPTYDFPLARPSRSPILVGFSDAGSLARAASTPTSSQDLTPRPAPRRASIDLRSAALNLVALLLSPETPSGQGSAPSRPITPRRRHPEGQALSVLQLLTGDTTPAGQGSAPSRSIAPRRRYPEGQTSSAIRLLFDGTPPDAPAGQGSAPARVLARLAVRRHEAGQPSLLSTLLLSVATAPIGAITAEPPRRALRILSPSVALSLAALIEAATTRPPFTPAATSRHPDPWLGRRALLGSTLGLAAGLTIAQTQPPFTPSISNLRPDPWRGRLALLGFTLAVPPQPPQQQFYAPGQVGPWGNFPLRARPYPRGVGGLQLDLQPVWLYLVELLEITYSVAGPAAAGIVYEAVVDALQVRYQVHSDGLDG